MNRSKRIGTFKEFCQERKRRIKENVNIEVEWWDECKVEVLQDLEKETETYGGLTWDNLVKYVKNKNAILGRNDAEYDADILPPHIKELIFQHHGDSFIVDGMNGENAEVHSKGVVIEELANEILDMVIEMSVGSGTEKTPTITMKDKVKTRLVPMQITTVPDEEYDDECYDDLPFERKVKSYEQYSKLLENRISFCKVKLVNYEKALNHTLETLENLAGSLNLGDIYNWVMKDAPEIENKGDMLLNYIKNIAKDYINSEGKFKTQMDHGFPDIPRSAIEYCMDEIASQIVDDVIDRVDKGEF